MNFTRQEFVNHYPHNQNFHSNVTNIKSKKHKLSNCPNKQGATKKLKKSLKSDEREDLSNVKANTSNINEDFANSNCLLIKNHKQYYIAKDCKANINIIFFAKKFILFQQSL